MDPRRLAESLCENWWEHVGEKDVEQSHFRVQCLVALVREREIVGWLKWSPCYSRVDMALPKGLVAVVCLSDVRPHSGVEHLFASEAD
jgi:hypothetical protein